MAYWQRTAEHAYRPTEHVGGSWDLATQHIAPALGILAHEVELDRDRRRGADLMITRLSYDILGTLPLEEVEVDVEVLRPGRTIELVQATARHGGRAAVLLRAWLAAGYATDAIAGTEHVPVPGPDEVEPWPMGELWEGGFIASAELRRRALAPGRSVAWVRTPHALVEGESASVLASVAGLVDIANGVAVRAEPTEVAFPNLDLTAHLFRQPSVEPVGGWLGLDTTVSFGAAGTGLTSTVLHDAEGPFGTMAQILTVRP